MQLGGKLDPAHQFQSRLGRQRQSLVISGERVVIGDAEGATPARPASSTSCAGENVPSDAVVCECKSIIAKSGIRIRPKLLSVRHTLIDTLLGRFPRGMNGQLGGAGGS